MIEIGIDMYLDQEEKRKLFRKGLSVRLTVRPSVRAQKLCTLKLKNGFFLLKVVYCESKLPKFRFRFTKLEPNEIVNDFVISREPFDEIDSNFF